MFSHLLKKKVLDYYLDQIVSVEFGGGNKDKYNSFHGAKHMQDSEMFVGTIKTGRHIISWFFEYDNDCCEVVCVEFDPSHDNLMGKRLNPTLFDAIEDSDNYSEYYQCTLVLARDLQIIFSNSHNGYYCHNLDIQITTLDGETIHDWNVSL